MEWKRGKWNEGMVYVEMRVRAPFYGKAPGSRIATHINDIKN